MIMVWNNWYTSLLEKKNTLDLILTSLPGQFQNIHSPDKLSDHDIVSGTVYIDLKDDFDSLRKDASEFAKEKYFNGHSDSRSVQENLDLITSFIQDSAINTFHQKKSLCLLGLVDNPWD